MQGFTFKVKYFCPRQKMLSSTRRNVFVRTRNSLLISSHLPTVHIVTTAHHMEWGMETKWLFGLFSNILNFILLDIIVQYVLSPLSVIHHSPEDDDKHGDTVYPDVELPGGGADRLKLGKK